MLRSAQVSLSTFSYLYPQLVSNYDIVRMILFMLNITWRMIMFMLNITWSWILISDICSKRMVFEENGIPLSEEYVLEES